MCFTSKTTRCLPIGLLSVLTSWCPEIWPRIWTPGYWTLWFDTANPGLHPTVALCLFADVSCAIQLEFPFFLYFLTGTDLLVWLTNYSFVIYCDKNPIQASFLLFTVIYFLVSTFRNLLFVHGHRDVVSVPAPINQLYTDARVCERQRTAVTISFLFMLSDSNRDWDIAKFFFWCLMRLFLSPQLTASSHLTMSHIEESDGIAFKSAPSVSVLVACMFLCGWTWERPGR